MRIWGGKIDAVHRNFSAKSPRSRTRGTFPSQDHDRVLWQMAMWDAPPMACWPDLRGKLRQHSAPLSLERLFDQCSRPRPDQIRPPIGRKSVWSGPGGAGLSRSVAYPVLCRELRRVTTAKIYRPPGPSPTFGCFSMTGTACTWPRSKRAMGGAKRVRWSVIFQAAYVVSPHNPALKVFAVDCELPHDHTRLSSPPLQDSARPPSTLS